MKTGIHAKNLVSGFKATGLFPLDRSQVLKRLPQMKSSDVTQSIFNEAVMEVLHKNCGVGIKKKERMKRGAKVNFSTFTIFNVKCERSNDNSS